MHEGFINFNAGTLGVSMVEVGSLRELWLVMVQTWVGRRQWVHCLVEGTSLFRLVSNASWGKCGPWYTARRPVHS